MSSFRKLLLIIVVIILFAVGGYVGYTYATTNFEEGTITGTSYESSFLNMRIDLPDNFNMTSTSKLGELSESTDSETLDTIEMLAVSDTALCNIVILTVESNPFESVSNGVEQAKEKLAGDMDYSFSDTTVKRLAGEPYYFINAKGTSAGRTLDQDLYFTKIGVRFCMVVITYDAAVPKAVIEKNALLASITAYD